MAAQFPHLTRPGRIGSLEIRNRMFVTAMGVNLAEADGSCGDRLIAFHERQARGGAGLIVLGVPGVAWPHGGNQPRQIAISEDRHIPGLRALANAVHAHGTRVAAQLHHGGLVAAQDMKEGRPVWVPSLPEPGPSDLFDVMLPEESSAFMDPDAPPIEWHPMTREDIEQLIGKFAAAAERAREAGLDGVEIHAGHGYIISDFLTPALNRREDGYGGSLAQRARLLLEIIAAVRAKVGDDFPVWCKLDSKEYGKHNGICLEDAVETARMAQAAGADAITVTAYHDAGRGALHSESHTPHVPNHNVGKAAAIKAAVTVPVIASGRIEPASAERFIGDGCFDFLAMGRKILADPDLPNKITAGAPAEIRPCIYCYACISRIYVLDSVRCTVNPETGFETAGDLIATDRPRHIGVVGGGPAGMEVTLRLLQRGFRVSLFESARRLGGTLAFAAIAYEPNGRLLQWLRRQLAGSRAEVHLGRAATPDLLRRLGIEEVVIATGAKRGIPDGIAGSDRDFVFSGEEMRALLLAEPHPELRRKVGPFTRWVTRVGAVTGVTGNAGLLRRLSKGWLPLGKKIVILGSELVGLELAEFLAERNREVTVVDETAHAGRGLPLVRRMRLLDDLRELGVAVVGKASNIRIGDYHVGYRSDSGEQVTIDVDHVILAKGAAGDTELAQAFRAAGFVTHAIGDCTGVSHIAGALESAAKLAMKL